MPNPLLRALGFSDVKRAVETIVPRRTFDDVVLAPETRRAIRHALAEISSHDLIFRQWGLGERHPRGVALAFNFAGPPGTGKTICAEAIANALGRPLLAVRYAEVASMWMGETAKNVVGIFRLAREQNAVLLFDEADAIASRRSAALDQASQREINGVVNVLLQELEAFSGVVIFTTNMAANFDRAFERRIRTHVLFDMPGPVERAAIWRVQIHPTLTPLAADVDFRALGAAYEASGGDIRNAVLKAALAAAIEPGTDAAKQIHQRHFEAGIRDVLTARVVMRQTIGHDDAAPAEARDIATALLAQTGAASATARWPSVALSAIAVLIAIAALAVALMR